MSTLQDLGAQMLTLSGNLLELDKQAGASWDP